MRGGSIISSTNIKKYLRMLFCYRIVQLPVVYVSLRYSADTIDIDTIMSDMDADDDSTFKSYLCVNSNELFGFHTFGFFLTALQY